MDAPDTAPDTTNRWIDDRLRALDPPDTWEPATAVALAHFRERAAASAAADGAAPRTAFGVGADLAALFGVVIADARGPGSRPPASHA